MGFNLTVIHLPSQVSCQDHEQSKTSNTQALSYYYTPCDAKWPKLHKEMFLTVCQSDSLDYKVNV